MPITITSDAGRSLPGALRQLRLAHDDIRPLRDRVDRTVGNTHAAAERFDAFAETGRTHGTRSHTGIAGEDDRADRPFERTGRTARSSDNRSVRLLNGFTSSKCARLTIGAATKNDTAAATTTPASTSSVSPFGAIAATAMMLPGDATAVSPFR